MTILSTGCPLNVSHVQYANAILPDDQVLRCRIVNILHDGIVHVVHEHEAVVHELDVGRYGESASGRRCVLCHGRRM